MTIAMKIRSANLKRLASIGFKPSPNLPVIREAITALRPARELAMRLMALDALFTWVSEDEHAVAGERVRAYAKRNRLTSAMTREERAIFKQTRRLANARNVDTIGWRLENMWPIAWALGFAKEPAPDGVPVTTPIIHEILLRFLPGLEKTVDDLLSRARPRTETAVVRLEDVYYCAHNAARNARRGNKTVPRGFDPVEGTAVIHERRHALTWCLSPGVTWDDVDLST